MPYVERNFGFSFFVLLEACAEDDQTCKSLGRCVLSSVRLANEDRGVQTRVLWFAESHLKWPSYLKLSLPRSSLATVPRTSCMLLSLLLPLV